MTLRLAIRALTSRPVRSAVLALGFGFGIAVMAGLLGVGEVILEQARTPALGGGGDLRISGALESGAVPHARFVLAGVLAKPPFADRVAAVSPWRSERLYLVQDGEVHPLRARGGIPSLERAMADPETSEVVAWVDTPADADWAAPPDAAVLRGLDRFHAVPDDAGRFEPWLEWLYFNGRTDNASFYLSFIAARPDGDGRSRVQASLQLERGQGMEYFEASAEIPHGELLARAPDLDLGGTRVRLDGMRYVVVLDLQRRRGRVGPTGAPRPPLRPGRREAAAPSNPRGVTDRITGEIRIDASLAQVMSPIVFRGVSGWVSGYVVPVLSGPLGGWLETDGERIPLDGGTGYHDHNWGFWGEVTWRWGQLSHEGTSFVWGRVIPPADVVDPDRLPAFLRVAGPDGTLGFSTDVAIEESDAPGTTRPERIVVRARGLDLDLELDLAVESLARTPVGPEDEPHRLDFLQMRGPCRVSGRIREREIEWTAPASAETFREPQER